MSTYAQFLSGGGGSHTSNPKQMSRVQCAAASMVLRQQATETAGNTTSFCSLMPGFLDTDWVADTYKPIVSISSGSGFVSAMVGPTCPSAATITFRVEVDGVTTDYAIASVASGSRALLGRARNRSASATDPRDVFSDMTAGLASIPTGTITAGVASSNGVMVLTPFQCFATGIGMLRYERSFSLQMKSSVAITATAAGERRCGALYTLE